MAQSRAKAWSVFMDVVATVAAVAACVVLAIRFGPFYGNAAEQPAASLPTDPVNLSAAPSLGSTAAPVTMVIYSDFECTFCGRFARDTWPALQHRFVDTGKVVVHFKYVPLPIHEHALAAARAANCTNPSGQFWRMHDLIFSHQEDLTARRLERDAVSLGLEPAAYRACAQKDSRVVADDLAEATRLGVRGTPTFFFGTTNSNRTVTITGRVSGARPASEFETAIESALAKTKRSAP